MSSLDLNVLPFLRQNGQDASSFPGLYMVTPPRQAARGRSLDQLILFFNMVGNAPLTSQQQEQLLGRLAQTYYKTPGSITAALKTTIDAMNQFLLDRNLRSSSSGKQCIGLMSLLVLRETSMLLAQSGPVHTFLSTQQENQEFFDPQGAGRGLGLTRAVSVRYYQFELHPNDLLLLTPSPAPAWNTSVLQITAGQGLETLRRRLLSQAGPDVSAVIIQVQAGTGKLRLLRTKAPLQMAQPPAQLETKAETQPVDQITGTQTEPPSSTELLPQDEPGLETTTEAGPEIPAPAPAAQDAGQVSLEQDQAQAGESSQTTEGRVTPGIEPAQEETLDAIPPDVSPPVVPPSPAADKPQITPAALVTGAASPIADPGPLPGSQPVTFSTRAPAARRTSEAGAAATSSSSTRPGTTRSGVRRKAASGKSGLPRPSLPKLPSIPVGRAFARVGQAVAGTLASVAQAILGLMKRILPDESLFTIPASTMAFVAVAIAIIMAVAGSVVYDQRGRAAQYQVYYEQALAQAERAVQQTTPLELRTAWETTLDYLDKADSYKITPDSSLLRSKAMQALDKLDGIVRLDFQPAITSALGGPAEVSRIVANDTDLYLLNKQGGNVLRATLTGRGYEIDPNFTCGPNPKIGPLIDIAPLPKGNSFKATILAMDVNGNLLYCIPGSLPIENAPAPPQPGWGEPTAFTLDAGDLYALDPKTNGVWIYRAMAIDRQPHLFFGDQVPFMQDVVGFTVNNDDLFLLHKDGHLTTCVYSQLQVAATRCTDPATYVDRRQGRQNGPLILDAQFSQILYTQPPDPSIYMLDPFHQAIYHFSVKLSLQEQFRSKNPLHSNTNATAFTVTQNRMVFLAVGNQIYYASLP
jgi:hypothetical protein